METVVSVFVLKILKSMDRDTFFVFYRISITCKNNTNRCIVLKFQIDLIKFAVYTGFHYFNDIILHTRKNNLCLRIPKSCIIFQNLRAICSKHQSEENDSLKRTSLCCHGIYCFLINIFLTEFIYFRSIERTWRKCSHSACIQSLIPILRTLVILCGCHGTDRLSIYKRKYGNLTASHKFFNYHGISGISEFFVFHDLFYASFCLCKILADQNTFSKSKAICLQNDREFCLGP